MKEIARILEHPSSNGMVERLNSIVEYDQGLYSGQTNWLEPYLGMVGWIYGSTMIHVSTNFIPSMLMLGPSSILDLVYGDSLGIPNSDVTYGSMPANCVKTWKRHIRLQEGILSRLQRNRTSGRLCVASKRVMCAREVPEVAALVDRSTQVQCLEVWDSAQLKGVSQIWGMADAKFVQHQTPAGWHHWSVYPGSKPPSQPSTCGWV